MANSVIQTSFHAGEWAPALNARVDLAKYHSAAALLQNFFVDYRGGASTRPGTKYIIQCYKSATAVRLLPFQASFTVSYVLEFGDQYIRFSSGGSPVLESTIAITGVTQANPAVVTVANTYNVGDWVYITGVVGMTELNGRYFKISARAAGSITLADVNGVAVNSTGYGAWTSGGTVARVYTIPSPYAAADLAKIKYAQNVDKLILCHPNYVPYVLTLISAANWTLVPIVFGTPLPAPTNVAITASFGAGSVNYAYTVTAVDINGQESAPATPGALANKLDLRTTGGSFHITWTAAAGAQSYNVYKAEPSYTGAIPTGAAYGFIGNSMTAEFSDANIAPDFSLSPPLVQSPFSGAGLASITITAAGAYTAVPTVSIAAAPATGVNATAVASLKATVIAINNNGSGHAVGDIVTFGTGFNVKAVVATVDGVGGILTFQALTFPGSNPGSITSGATPANPLGQIGTTGVGVGATADITWGVGAVSLLNAGQGYLTAPAVTFAPAGATATAVLQTINGNPSVPAFFQQRLVLAAPTNAPQTFYMSQPGSPYNFNTSNPIQADNAITGTIVSDQLNEIKSMVPVPSGLIMLTSSGSWLVNGGTSGSPVSPDAISANAQSFNGASDVQPIVANFDILYVQAKGSIVRDSTYNFYANVFTGTDISILSSHLFYGYTIVGWAWAEEPFKIVWAVRDDGTMLTLTFMKEQELIGWSHSVTTGSFKSVTTVTETVSFGAVNAVYTVVERVINGNTVKYIERVMERKLSTLASSSWCVDAGLQYNGAPATNFSGGEHLAGATVTGLADGVVITPFVMPTTGRFTLATAASIVTVGLAYTCKLQTLALDLGEPTVQGKRKQITAVTARCQDTLGLRIGRTFSTLVAMKDLVLGNVGSASNEVVTGLVTADARTVIDASWTVPGQYCIQQDTPLPASILGIIPEVTVGDTQERRG